MTKAKNNMEMDIQEDTPVVQENKPERNEHTGKLGVLTYPSKYSNKLHTIYNGYEQNGQTKWNRVRIRTTEIPELVRILKQEYKHYINLLEEEL